MSVPFRWLAALAATTALSSAVSFAATLNLLPSHDDAIYGPGSPNNSNGGGQHMFVGGTRADRGLIEFDLSAIPTGAVVQSATLTMFMDRSSGASPLDVFLQKLNASWTEGASGASGTDIGIRGGGGMGFAATTGDVTWTSRGLNTLPNWTTAGGTFATTASAQTSVGVGQSTNGTPPIRAQWSSNASAAMLADVSSWVSNPSANFGWMLCGDEVNQGNTPLRFMTTENYFNGSNPRMNYDASGSIANDGTLTPDFRPRLSITYDVPEPTSLAAIAIASAMRVRRRR